MVSKSQRHKQKILDGIANMGNITEDRYGNFILPDGKRYHQKKTALNKQVKLEHGWFNIWSAYYKDLEITEEGKLKILKKIR